jgi:Bacterial regulatory protein, Fis family
MIVDAIARIGNNKSHAARLLGLRRGQFRSRFESTASEAIAPSPPRLVTFCGVVCPVVSDGIVNLGRPRAQLPNARRRHPYPRYRFPPTIISHAVWLYYPFTLSFRDVEDLLAQRGIDRLIRNRPALVSDLRPRLRDGSAVTEGPSATRGIWTSCS